VIAALPSLIFACFGPDDGSAGNPDAHIPAVRRTIMFE